ncbi:stage III sporulation protein AG [Lederbergia citrea]|uniref:stage III sporulation protein AG n=1 Tax=Lederbergia citrea TaxID=2833581 RepID=UPI001BC9DBE3|nr:stage III sporulation protein AG [Lederbergia citrea]MBS4176381.1 stage III sporulation protein AG [Lederbergia citrea]
MINKNGPLDWIKNKFGANTNAPPEKNSVKLYYLIILLVLGVVFMMLGSFWKGDSGNQTTEVFNNQNNDIDSTETFGQKKLDNKDGMKDFENQYENQLKEALEEIVGVTSVTVVVNVESTERKVFEKNTTLKNQTTSEEDKEGGTRKIEDQSKEDELVIIRDGEKDVPVTSETRKPEIKGVLIVAGGAENIQVEKWIREAVTRVLNVPNHKVAVLPKKSKGDS